MDKETRNGLLVIWFTGMTIFVLYLVVLEISAIRGIFNASHDYRLSLLNGYILTQDGLMDKDMQKIIVRPEICKIGILSELEVVIGKRRNISEDSGSNKKVEYFYFDTSSKLLKFFDTELALRKYITKKFEVKYIPMKPPSEWSGYRRVENKK